MDRQYIYKTREITATPRNKRIVDVIKTVVSSGISGGGATVPQYWELVTVAADGSALAQEDYYLRPRQELNVVSQRNLIAYGDVIAKSVDEEIDDAELPKAGYGITNFGLTAIKQGGGLLVDSNNLVYIDPNYAGGGGLDIEQLEQYLTANFYMKKNDPASYLLMTGYAMPETYAPVTSTDTVLTAIGKLERNFGNYVTIATQQTVTGKKTFAQDIIGQRDIICKSTSTAISDAELPIASKTQLGLIKVGSGFEIATDGTLNNAGGGGLTEVYWTDIKNPPSTLAGYGITDALGKNETAVAASKLSPGCKIWGQTLTGEKDITGSLTDVGDITFSSSAAYIKKENAGSYIIYSQESGQLNISAYNGKTILFGYRGTSGYQFYAGKDGGNSVGSAVGSWNSDSLKVYVPMGIDVSDPLEKLHVGGSVLITGSLKFDNAFSINRNDLTGMSYIMQSQDSGQLNINAYGGNTILFGYRGTSGYQFYAGTEGGDSIGSAVGSWNTTRLYIATSLGVGTSSPQAKVHVVGDGLFTGDVICKSTSTAIPDTELPIASTTQLGLIKAGNGVSIAADGTLSFTGGGGLTEVYWDDIKGKPTTLAGYGIKAGDMLTTLKTVDGSTSGLDADLLDGKHNGDLTAKFFNWDSSSNWDCNNPTYTLHRYYGNAEREIKNVPDEWSYGNLFTIGNQGNLNGNLSGQFIWDVSHGTKNPGTLWFRTKDSVNGWDKNWGKIAFITDNVASASKLSPGCKIWGQAFTGEKDITGALSDVSTITFSSSAAYVKKENAGSYIINSQENGQLNISAYNGKNILFGYRGTSGYQFYAGTEGGDSIGSSIGSWNTVRLYTKVSLGVNTASPSERFHVVGNALIAGRLITEQSSTSYTHAFTSINKAITGTDRDYKWIIYHGITGVDRGLSFWSYDLDNTVFNQVFTIQAHPSNKIIVRGMADVRGDGLFTGDVIAKSTSTAISDAELPIASASTLGLIKVGSGLKITNGVLSVSGGSGGGSNVYWGSPTDDMVPLYVDESYYELSRKKHKHAVSTNGTGNAVTSISFNKDTGGMILSKGSTFSLNGHTHSQYLTSHQTIYKLTIQKNGSTVGTYTPNAGAATINITTSGGGGWSSGTYTDNGICRVNNSGGAGLAFWNDTEKTGLRVGGGNGIKGYNDTYDHLGNLFFNYVSSSVNVKIDAYGKIYSNGTALSSDLRLKEVVGYESDVLERMTKIPVIKFYRKDVGDNVQTTGFGAQSFQGIFDNVTILNKDSGYYMISETSILGITFQGVKELYTLQKQTTNEIDALEQRIALLEAENQNLWNIINEKEAA